MRLSLLYPEMGVMQTRAIIRAALAVRRRGLDPSVEIMVPLVGFAEELRRMREIVVATADEELASAGVADLGYRVGTMIELPRAALTADEIAEHGGDPASIAVFDAIGLDYVSCSPYRLPIARLAAALTRLDDTTHDDAAHDQGR